ncbi:MAG: hypothetical protein HY247_03830 [archaeon]|nr:MAG: hypothetical protein HY247_03830 [archaeon]
MNRDKKAVAIVLLASLLFLFAPIVSINRHVVTKANIGEWRAVASPSFYLFECGALYDVQGRILYFGNVTWTYLFEWACDGLYYHF